MSLDLKLGLRQRQAMTPQLQQALRLLQLSSLEFREEIQQMLASNPFLEEGPSSETGSADAATDEIAEFRDSD